MARPYETAEDPIIQSFEAVTGGPTGPASGAGGGSVPIPGQPQGRALGTSAVGTGPPTGQLLPGEGGAEHLAAGQGESFMRELRSPPTGWLPFPDATPDDIQSGWKTLTVPQRRQAKAESEAAFRGEPPVEEPMEYREKYPGPLTQKDVPAS